MENERCEKHNRQMIGCDHPYCPQCREAAAADRKAKRAGEVRRNPRCRDCGSFGPVDGRGLGWNCGCASE